MICKTHACDAAELIFLVFLRVVHACLGVPLDCAVNCPKLHRGQVGVRSMPVAFGGGEVLHGSSNIAGAGNMLLRGPGIAWGSQ